MGKRNLFAALVFVLSSRERILVIPLKFPTFMMILLSRNIFMGQAPSSSELNTLKKLVELFGLDELTGSFTRVIDSSIR